MSKITEIVSALAKPVIEAEGCTLWDVEYVREAGSMYLRVFVDKAGGLGIDDCERISRALDPILDEAAPVPGTYIFEVGSPGLERELKRPSDFVAFMGSEVVLKFYSPINGVKSCVGVLSSYDNETIGIIIGDEERSYDMSKLAKVNLHVSF